MAKQIRKQPRRHLVYYLKVLDPTSGQVLGHLIDITPFGMMMISKNALEPGQEMTVRIQLPEDMAGPGCMDLSGHIVWCHKDVNPDYYAAGLEFRPPSQENSFIIKDLIDTLGFHN